MKVSIVIVTWNAKAVLLDCLRSLELNPPGEPWEAIVVDNASGDGTVEAVREAAPWATVLANQRNLGLAAANNQGMGAATGECFLIANPDILFRAGTVDELLGAMRRHPRAAFVFANLKYPDGRQQTSAGDLPTLGAVLGRMPARRRRATQGAMWWEGWAHDEERVVGHGLEACYLVRREAVREIGPQDEGYPLDWEGLDWCARAADAGWETWFCPTAVAVHVGSVTLRLAEARWIRESHRGMYRYFSRRAPAPLRPLLAGLFAARAGVKLATMLTTTSADRWSRRHPA